MNLVDLPTSNDIAALKNSAEFLTAAREKREEGDRRF